MHFDGHYGSGRLQATARSRFSVTFPDILITSPFSSRFSLHLAFVPEYIGYWAKVKAWCYPTCETRYMRVVLGYILKNDIRLLVNMHPEAEVTIREFNPPSWRSPYVV
jgi:hypothetical protein